MTEFTFTLSKEDTDRLFAIKKLRGKDKMTGNEFAAELLVDRLHSLFPSTPQYDEEGNLTNPESFFDID